MTLRRESAHRGSLLDDALLEDDVGVNGGLAGGDDGVGLVGAIVEGEALKEADLRARLVLFDNGLVLVPDGSVGGIAGGLSISSTGSSTNVSSGKNVRMASSISQTPWPSRRMRLRAVEAAG